jgi:type IV pilus biogenesis protein CpaD/CtpE
MKSKRFLVTSVLFFGTLALVACTSKTDKRSAQVDDGNRQIKAAAVAQNELAAKFNIALSDPAKFDWNKLSKNDRQSVKEKLAEYVSAVTRTFEIDAKKGLYLTKKEILQRQLDSAMGLQKSLENFERVYGENFEPKKSNDHA